MAVQDLDATKAEDRAFLAGLPVFVSLSWLETFRPSPSTADVAKELAHSLSWAEAACSTWLARSKGRSGNVKT